MICGPQWSQGELGEHRHPAGQIDVTDTTTLPDELDALKSADTQLGSQLTELSSKVEQAGGDKIGDIKVSVRTDLGDDWCLCNGDPISPEYSELAESVGGVQITGEWTPLSDFVSNMKGQDYFIYNNVAYTIRYENTTWYLCHVEDFEVVKERLCDHYDTGSSGGSWTFFNNTLYLCEDGGYNTGRSYIRYASFNGTLPVNWQTITRRVNNFNSNVTSGAVSKGRVQVTRTSTHMLYLCSVGEGSSSDSSWISQYWVFATTNPLSTTVTELSAVGPNVSSSKNYLVQGCYCEASQLCCVYVTRSGISNNGVSVFDGTSRIAYATNVGGSYNLITRVFGTMYACFDTNYTNSNYKYVVCPVSSLSTNPDMGNWNTVSDTNIPKGVLRFSDGRILFYKSGGKLHRVTSRTSSPYFTVAETYECSNHTSISCADVRVFESSACYIAGPILKAALLPSISLSEKAYTYIKRK